MAHFLIFNWMDYSWMHQDAMGMAGQDTVTLCSDHEVT